MKRLFSIALSAVIAAGLCTSACAEETAPGDSAEAAVLINADSGEVLYGHDEDEHMLIASTTKLMTALVVLDRCDPDSNVSVDPDAVGVEGSSVYLQYGEVLTVGELLYCLLLESGNDAAAALAYYTAGSIGDFAGFMNAKARELGCENSSFKNPHGLDEDGHYSSAADLAKIMAAAMRYELFVTIISTKSIEMAGRELVNHNRLLWSYDGMIGGKTGYTSGAGRSLVTCAERDGDRYICVTLGDPDDWDDHAALYDWAFENFKSEELGAVSREVPVITGKADHVTVTSYETETVTVRSGDEVEVRIYLPRFVYAPVYGGDIAGTAEILINGETRSVTELTYDYTVELDEGQRMGFVERLMRTLFPWG